MLHRTHKPEVSGSNPPLAKNCLKILIKKFKKIIQNFIKNINYKIFFIFNGKINSTILATEDKRIKVQKVIKSQNIHYKIYTIEKGRLYTDRVQDTAVILDNSIIEGPSQQLRFNNNASAIKNIVFEKGTPRFKKKLNGTVLSLLTGGAGNKNYSHWLFDVLPRIALYEEIENISKINFFLLPSFEEKFQKETLAMLNLDKEKWLSSQKYRHILSSKLIITDHPYCITNDSEKDITKIPYWISQWLRNKFINADTNDYNFPAKIYIDRSDSSINSKRMRQITNENELREFLKKDGFKIVTLGKMSFTEQVKTFNNAKIIVSMHGSGLANLVFCKTGAKIIEFKNNDNVKQIENLAKINNLIYRTIVSEPLKFKNKGQNGHIHIPIIKLQKILNEIRL